MTFGKESLLTLIPGIKNESLANDEQAKTYISEAEFFYAVLHAKTSELNPRRVCEVGSGVGLVAEAIARSGHEVTAFEPESSGFSRMHEISKLIIPDSERQAKVIADFFDSKRDGPFDLIYSINVLEHVENHSVFLSGIYQMLSPGGTAYLIFPNYSFPYEPHLHIPILLNKTVTERVFRETILESGITDPENFWMELSFPKTRQILSIASSLPGNPEVKANNEVLESYFARIAGDPVFESRKSGKVFQVARKVANSQRFVRLITQLWPRTLQPIGEITITKPTSSRNS